MSVNQVRNEGYYRFFDFDGRWFVADPVFYEVLEDITHNNKRLLDLWELESKNFDFVGINC